MKLFVIGATGRTGQEVVGQAMGREYEVTAVGAVPRENDPDPRTSFDPRGHPDGRGTALGPVDTKTPTTLLSDSARATVGAMKRENAGRIVVLSAAAHFPGFLNGIVRRILRDHMQDSMAMEEVVRASGLDWTIARPPRLTEENDLSYRARAGAPPKMGFFVSRSAVAAFMPDVLDRYAHLRQIAGVAR